MASRMRRMLIGLFGLSGLAAVVGYSWQRRQRAAQATQALAALAQRVQPRSAWGAVEPVFDNFEERGPYNPLTNPGGYRIYADPLDQLLRTLVVHHSALSQRDGPREIQRMHLKDKGYADIGYHFVIDGQGAIYEGRPINVRGAHVGGFNTGSVGVCLMGNFETESPTRAQLNSLMELGALLRDGYGITHLAGHHDFRNQNTVCPGKHLIEQLTQITERLGLKFGTDGYVG